MDGRTDRQAQTNMPPQLLRSWGHKNHMNIPTFPFDTFFYCFTLHFSSERALLNTAHKTFNRQAVV